jgi:hypothetical protein
VSRKRANTHLYRWIAISLAAHIVLLLLPADFYRTIFPRRTVGSGGGMRDLTPDFAEVAIAILLPPAEPVAELAEEVPEEAEETEEEPVATPSVAPSVESSGEGGGTGEGIDGSGGEAAGEPTGEAVFFPARPRLIVPPALEDLEIKSLRVDLKILVGADGVPEQVVIPDSLAGSEIGLRLEESARRFRFEPAKKGDLPISSWVDLPLLLESSPRK